MNRNLVKSPGSTKNKKIVGRGSGSKKGTTAGRGHKGFKARSGNGKVNGFEGGQMPLIRKLPKVGFSNYPFKKLYQIVRLGSINEKFNDGEEVSVESLKIKNLISSRKKMVKVVGGGDFIKKLIFDQAIMLTQSVKKTIEEKGSSFKK